MLRSCLFRCSTSFSTRSEFTAHAQELYHSDFEFAEALQHSIRNSDWSEGSLRTQMRLLFVGNSFDYFVSHRLALAKAARSAGWSVHVAAPPGKRGASLQSHGITQHLLALDRKGINPLRELRSLLRIRQIYDEVRPDLVHLIGPKSVMYGGLLARWQSIPAMVCLIPGMGYMYFLGGLKGRIVRAMGVAGYCRCLF